MPAQDKMLTVLSGEIKTPPLSKQARIDTGVLLRRLQRGEVLSMPHSRPMPVIGPRCYELRILDRDAGQTWRVLYQQTPRHIIDTCIRRLREWDAE